MFPEDHSSLHICLFFFFFPVAEKDTQLEKGEWRKESRAASFAERAG